MRRVLVSSLVLALGAYSAVAQKTKPWTELSEKEAAKILNDSPWGQTQTEGEESRPEQTSAITQVAAPRAAQRELSREGEAPTENKPSRVVRYRTRFLSAKPVRGAFARIVLLKKGEGDEGLSTQLQGFVDRDFGDYVVVAVTAEAADARLVGATMQFLTNATADAFKDKVYLERKDGKRPVGNDSRQDAARSARQPAAAAVRRYSGVSVRKEWSADRQRRTAGRPARPRTDRDRNPEAVVENIT